MLNPLHFISHSRTDRWLADFLRLSRSAIDDAITQNLNALSTPSRSGFPPNSTNHRSSTANSRRLGEESCESFKTNILFSAWQARTDLLNYCDSVARDPDPTDPDASSREIENQKWRDRVVDERLDPYSGRFFPREARTQTLAALVHQERGIEDIVRSRTWDIVKERCVTQHDKWQDAMKARSS